METGPDHTEQADGLVVPIEELLEPNPRQGMFLHKGVRCSVLHGMYNVFYGSYCLRVARGETLNIEHILPEASSLVFGYEGVLTLDTAEELCGRIQDAILREYTVDKLSDNYIGCVVTVGKETSYVYVPQVRVVRSDYNSVNFYNMAPDIDSLIFNPLAQDTLPMYGSDDQVYLCCVSDKFVDGESSGLEVHSHMAHTKVENDIVKATMFEDYEHEGMPETMWLPMALSPDYWRTITRPYDKSAEECRETLKAERVYPDLRQFISVPPVVTTEWTNKDYKMFLKMWRPDRLFDPVYWKDVGKAFRNLWTREPKRGLTAWVQFLIKQWPESRQDVPSLAPGLVLRTCTSVYKSFASTGIDIKTFAWYARIDSPKKYCEWHYGWVMEAFKASFRGTHRDVGLLAYRLFWLDFVAIKGDKHDVLYKFTNHALRKDYGFARIRSMLNNELILQYNRFRADVAGGMRDSTIGHDAAKLIYASIDAVVDSLGNYGFKTKVISELCDLFNVTNLTSLMDQDKELTLLKNGVMVVADGKLHFRDGKPQDYLSTSFGGYYREEYSWDSIEVVNAMEWATITFVDPDTISYFWKYLASMFIGGNQDKKLVFMTGESGNNMKTTWQNQISLVLGERCIVMPVNYYTMGTGKADSASPAIIRLAQGVRLMFSVEPDPTTPMIPSITKSIVGNDNIWARGNYQDGFEFSPQTSAAIVCNKMPPVLQDDAMKERVLALPFESQVTYTAPTDRAEQFKQRKFPRDPDFDSKLVSMVDAVTWIMVQFFSIWWKERLRSPPADVVRITKAYWDSIDRYSSFFRDNIVEDAMDSIDTIDLFTKFHRWHSTTYKKLDVPEKDTVVASMSKKFGTEPVDGLWHGFGFRVRQGAERK